jgi:hypothetical protein
MSLEGKLRDFGVADILQLLAQQQKTGILLVERKSDSAEVYFLNGQVVEARSTQHADRLGEMLVRGGYVTQEQIDIALERQTDTFEYLGNILVREGIVSHEIIQQTLRTQMTETFFDILQWHDGHYKFITEKFKKKGSLEDIPDIQTILLDILRMIDEWPKIRKLIPSFEVIFKLTDDQSADDIEIDEMPVYKLIDGKRNVQEIVDGSLLGRYEACKILADLLQDGFIKAGRRRETVQPEQHHAVIYLLFGPGAYAILLAVLMLASLYLPVNLPESILPPIVSQGPAQTTPIHAYRLAKELHRSRYALEAFYCQYARYPSSRQELVTAGLINGGMLTDSILYKKKSGHYSLMLFGQQFGPH